MPYYFYIVRCSDNSLYCGITTDLTRRIYEHNESSKAARYTRVKRPVTLVYAETYGGRSEALKREYEVKQYKKSDKELLIAMYQRQLT